MLWYMKFVYGILFLAVLVLACGCTTVPAPSATITAGTSANGTVLAELSSARPNASVALEPGAVVLTFHTDRAESMAFSFTEGTGTSYGEADDLVTTGPYTGSLVFGPPDSAEYQLNITGNDTWELTLTASAPSRCSPTSNPASTTASL